MPAKKQILNEQHWRFENYRQRITVKDWRNILLNDDDKIIFRGQIVRLIGKNLGSGVVEVFKATKEDQ